MRTISANNRTQATSEVTTAIHFIELQFSGGTLRLTDAPLSITWNSQTWLGTGFALSVGPMEETTDDRAQAIPLKLSGVDQSIIAILLAQFARGRMVNVWRGWYLANTGALVDTPILLFTGYMNESWTVEETPPQPGGPGTCEITTRVTSRFAAMEQRRGIQCNLMMHQAVYPDDLFFQYVTALQNVKIQWPNANFYK